MAEYRIPILDKLEWQEPVLDKDLTSPPGGESKGDRYLIYGTGSGSWSGQDGNIAEYNGSGWIFVAKREGMVVYVKDEDQWYKYISSWGIFGQSGYSGYSGTSGYSGYSGYSGISGYSGKSGYSGATGTFSVGGLLYNADGIANSAVNLSSWLAPFSCTLTAFKARVVGGTNAVVNARKNGADNHLSGDHTVTPGDGWHDLGSVQNTSYSSGDNLELMLISTSGTVTQVFWQLNFTKP